jgi:hypothetical protein
VLLGDLPEGREPRSPRVGEQGVGRPMLLLNVA